MAGRGLGGRWTVVELALWGSEAGRGPGYGGSGSRTMEKASGEGCGGRCQGEAAAAQSLVRAAESLVRAAESQERGHKMRRGGAEIVLRQASGGPKLA